MIACIREEYISEIDRQQYLEQIAANQIYIRRYVTPYSANFKIYTYRLPRWLSASPVNTSAWVTLVVSELENGDDARQFFVTGSRALDPRRRSRCIPVV
jgi:hypothetical protein